jgi:hypothetical protein
MFVIDAALSVATNYAASGLQVLPADVSHLALSEFQSAGLGRKQSQRDKPYDEHDRFAHCLAPLDKERVDRSTNRLCLI